MRPGFQTSLAIAYCTGRWDDQRLKAWPRGLRPLRCSFASLRMTRKACATSDHSTSFAPLRWSWL